MKSVLFAVGLALASPANADGLTVDHCFSLTNTASLSVQARDLGIPAHEILSGLLDEEPDLRGTALYRLISRVIVGAYTDAADMSSVEYAAVVLRACMESVE